MRFAFLEIILLFILAWVCPHYYHVEETYYSSFNVPKRVNISQEERTF